LTIHANPYNFWHDSKERYPLLMAAALKFLSAAPSSVPCEAWFSSAADLYSNKKRNKLSLSTARKMLFLQKAAPMIHYNYCLKQAPKTASFAAIEEFDIFSDESDSEHHSSDSFE
jgi:hypothetical protein